MYTYGQENPEKTRYRKLKCKHPRFHANYTGQLNRFIMYLTPGNMDIMVYRLNLSYCASSLVRNKIR